MPSPKNIKSPHFSGGRDGKGIIKGSCRSDGTTSIVHIMQEAKDAFLTFGGHHASGGFSVSHDAIHTLPEALVAAHAGLTDTEHQSDLLQVDARITLNDITDSLVRTLDTFAPFGIGNPKPLFEIVDVVPSRVQVFGKTQNHTKLLVRTALGLTDAICFFRLPETFSCAPEEGKTVTLLAHIEKSYFMGRNETRIRIVDIL